MADFNDLVRKRGIIKGQLTRFETFLMAITLDKIGQLPARIERCKEWWNEFDILQVQIEELDIDDPELQVQERYSFQDTYFESIALAEKKLSESIQITSSVSSSELVIAERNVKLPTMQVPTFQGSYKDWLEFFDTFNTLIHSNKGLTDIQKFYYLKNAVKGDAADVIRSLEVSADNYKEAWSLLKARFENKKIIALSHIESLYNFTPIIKESFNHIRKLLDEVRKDLRALKSLGQPVDSWDTLLIFILEAKLDPATRREWQKSGKVNTFATMKEFLQFLEERCVLLETIDSNRTGMKFDKPRFDKPSRAFMTSIKPCAICKENHPLFICKKFLSLSINGRRDEVKRSSSCWNCLRQGHRVQDCKMGGCKFCGKKHNSLLHEINLVQSTQENNSQGIGNVSAQGSSETNIQCVSQSYSCVTEIHSSIQGNNDMIGRDGSRVIKEGSTHTYVSRQESHILLSTVLVYIADSNGSRHRCRMLLDSGSQSNFITKEFTEKLQLSLNSVNIPVIGIGNGLSNIKYSVSMVVHSKFKDFKFNSTFLVIDIISDSIPIAKIDTSHLDIPENINLADEAFAEPDKIDGILGVSIFWHLICAGQIKLGKGEPILQKTRLGWIIAGQINNKGRAMAGKSRVCNFAANILLEEQIQQFWELEEYSHKKRFSREEAQCEQHFRETTKINQEGRFVVELPFRSNFGELGESIKVAHRRLIHTERKLEKCPYIKNQYHQFMREYIEMGHMSKIKEMDLEDSEKNIYYLPHHGVYKDDSITTKCRVVFDGSAATSTGVSLNDILMVGPQLQDTLFSISLRFRKHNVVITADVEKMFRQVLVKEEYRDLQRILWRFSEEQPVDVYRLNTVSYGTGPASYLAVRCLQQLGYDCKEHFPEASRVILKDFYMDDLLSGSTSVEEARVLKKQVGQVLEAAGFILRKWTSNIREVFSDDEGNGKEIDHYISEGISAKALGLLWNAEEDALHYKIMLDKNQSRVTKRTILSVISQIFDPLGLVGPVIVSAKIIMQQLWKVKVGWDESLPLDLHTSWVRFNDEISELAKIRIGRQVICRNPIDIQLHSFSDASIVAYGAAVYIRSTDAAGTHHVHLLCGKSRVAPVKVISLPRLELCAALLSARLVREVKDSIDINFSKVQFWSDSEIALSWIKGESSQWKTFVANRTSEIQDITGNDQWSHVISEDNPADVISRGIEPGMLGSFALWWHGPNWLSLDEELWQKKEGFSCGEVPDRKVMTHTFFVEISLDIFDRVSSFPKLQRVWAYCLRFIKKCRANSGRLEGALSLEEIGNATNSLIKLSQQQTFKVEIEALQRGRALHKSSRLISLNPFLDEIGIIRVGGRLKRADIQYEQKHPIILPIKHNLTDLIIRHEHRKHMHLGAQALLSIIRLKYWVLSGRSTVRKILHKCITCFRAKPTSLQYIMGDLPEVRVTPSRPFLNCGVDYAGPFEIRVHKLRGQKYVKAYLCLFVCFSTRAVHLELAIDLSTESFMNCFRRFMARRGLVQNMYSDNGTNFVGGNGELQGLYDFFRKEETQSKFSKYFVENMIRWHFIPPRAPNFGGLWEAAVKSAKYHIKRVLGNERLTYDEFHTVIVQVEACLNSRPLTPLSDDPMDLNVLTPGHFLIGSPLLSAPQEDLRYKNSNRIKKYYHLMQIVQHFWARWSKDYLSSLQGRTKWQSNSGNSNIQLGTMVVVKEDNSPPQKWELARITELHPGEDSIVRVVTVQTARGSFKRPVSRLSVLPIESN